MKLVNQVTDDLPTLSADPWRLEQVVTNLVDNAIKFTPAGGSVTVSAADHDAFVQVDVHDTGIGIPAGETERVFDRFYQVDASRHRTHEGAGLGLAICRSIVEAHGGRLWAGNNADGGATLHCELPVLPD